MMKMIKPIVNVSKIMDEYEALVVGFNGVLSDGKHIKKEAADAIVNARRQGKHIILLTNSPLRVASLAEILADAGINLRIFSSIITAGEIMHYKLKSGQGAFNAIGSKFFHIGQPKDLGVFYGLNYEQVADVSKADFLYVSNTHHADDTLNKYIPLLEHAASLNVPLICVGNDTSNFKDGQIGLAVGALAEQYAVLGGQILTIGKPDAQILEYCLDDFANIAREKILMIGDNLATDIKAANAAGMSSVLVSKGVHVNFLGEGYIPDVARVRELSNNFEAYPDFVVSQLRW